VPDYFDIEATLRGIDPPIRRRFLLAAGASFQDVHLAIQDAGGWLNYHLHSFREGRRPGPPIAGTPDDEPDADPDARRVRVDKWLGKAPRKKLLYEYDFGDGWALDVLVRRAKHEDVFRRRLVDGARAFPPEDAGGPGGYDRWCQVVVDGVDPFDELEEALEWIGDWHPEAFDLEALRKRFDRPKARRASDANGAKQERPKRTRRRARE
jgi:hypothetical protein